MHFSADCAHAGSQADDPHTRGTSWYCCARWRVSDGLIIYVLDLDMHTQRGGRRTETGRIRVQNRYFISGKTSTESVATLGIA